MALMIIGLAQARFAWRSSPPRDVHSINTNTTASRMSTFISRKEPSTQRRSMLTRTPFPNRLQTSARRRDTWSRGSAALTLLVLTQIDSPRSAFSIWPSSASASIGGMLLMSV